MYTEEELHLLYRPSHSLSFPSSSVLHHPQGYSCVFGILHHAYHRNRWQCCFPACLMNHPISASLLSLPPTPHHFSNHFPVGHCFHTDQTHSGWQHHSFWNWNLVVSILAASWNHMEEFLKNMIPRPPSQSFLKIWYQDPLPRDSDIFCL